MRGVGIAQTLIRNRPDDVSGFNAIMAPFVSPRNRPYLSEHGARDGTHTEVIQKWPFLKRHDRESATAQSFFRRKFKTRMYI